LPDGTTPQEIGLHAGDGAGDRGYRDIEIIKSRKRAKAGDGAGDKGYRDIEIIKSRKRAKAGEVLRREWRWRELVSR